MEKSIRKILCPVCKKKVREIDNAYQKQRRNKIKIKKLWKKTQGN